MKILPLTNVCWDSDIFDKFDSIIVQWAVEKCFNKSFNVVFPNYVFDKFKSDFTKENDFLKYINAFDKTLQVAINKEKNTYPRTISLILEIAPKQKRYHRSSIPTLLFGIIVFMNAHNKWMKKLKSNRLNPIDFLQYKNEKAYCHFSFLSNELKLALREYRYGEDFIISLRSKLQQTLNTEQKEEFKLKCFPIILNCGLPPQKEWTISRVFNVIDADHGGTCITIISVKR